VHSGWGAIAVTATVLAGGRARYRTVLAQAETALTVSARRLARRVARQAPPLVPPSVDLIGGLAGAAIALLARRGRSDVDEALDDVMTVLIGLADSVDGLPRLSSPPDWGGLSRVGDGPVLNLGVAHGMPGVLAVLSIARATGIETPGIGDAIGALADQLIRAHQRDHWGPLWPSAVSLDPAVEMPPPARMTWCYGTAGCARALWLAGRALNNPEWIHLSTEAIIGALRRCRQGQRPSSPTFCHGHAGLVHIALRFAADTADPDLSDEAAAELTHLLDGYDPGTRFGYRRIGSGGSHHDAVALLDGATGIAMVLLTASGSIDAAWDRIFLVG
jgi:hypothetical protein